MFVQLETELYRIASLSLRCFLSFQETILHL